jgi:hypothetical protein
MGVPPLARKTLAWLTMRMRRIDRHVIGSPSRARVADTEAEGS